jgi:hypothetical protein
MIAGSFGRIRAKTARDHGVLSAAAGRKVFGASIGAGLAWMRLCCRRWESALRL